ncbi:hypothetical protein MIZ03_2296 [Rhodoferax lithotrophicus]|uniref:Uncharacterized protein n=1 Tax=Rhodoferax lithotrophicus TaxID=2798804 RepID=A0ABN6D6U6_9BURK|nr:hypothetical protein MIZ03_2296 [Rhodoferax sp. MIZ03]
MPVWALGLFFASVGGNAVTSAWACAPLCTTDLGNRTIWLAVRLELETLI